MPVQPGFKLGWPGFESGQPGSKPSCPSLHQVSQVLKQINLVESGRRSFKLTRFQTRPTQASGLHVDFVCVLFAEVYINQSIGPK